MSIQVDPWLSQLFLITTGSGFPDADEDKMRQLAAALRRGGTDRQGLIAEVDAASTAALGAMRGTAAEQFRDSMLALTQGNPGLLKSLGDGWVALADLLDKNALDVEYTKWTCIAQLVQLAVQFLWTLAASAFGFGLPALALPGLVELGQTIVGKLIIDLVSHIVGGVIMQEMLDAAVQLAQFATGSRHGWDWDKTKLSVISGALGGAGGFGLHQLTHPLGHYLGHVLDHAAVNETVKNAAVVVGETSVAAAEEWLHAFLTNGVMSGKWDASYGDA